MSPIGDNFRRRIRYEFKKFKSISWVSELYKYRLVFGMAK